MSFGINLKKIRQDNNLTQEELAKKINTSRSNIANYENDKNMPSVDILEKISKIFNCSIDYLMGNSEFKTKEEELIHYKKTIVNSALLDIAPTLLDLGLSSEKVLEVGELLLFVDNEKNINKLTKLRNSFSDKNKKKFDVAIDLFYSNVDRQLEFDNLKSLKKEMKQYYMCPVYGQISAGQPNWAEECIEGRLMLDPDLMGIVNPEEHFFLRVNGESMNKVIKNGAFALIHKQDMVNDGEIAVVLVNGYDATLKKFTRQGDMIILEPQSTDTSIKTQVYDKTTPIKILGKYVGKMEINK